MNQISEEILDAIWQYVDSAYQIAAAKGLDEIRDAIAAASEVVLAAYEDEQQS